MGLGIFAGSQHACYNVRRRRQLAQSNVTVVSPTQAAAEFLEASGGVVIVKPNRGQKVVSSSMMFRLYNVDSSHHISCVESTWTFADVKVSGCTKLNSAVISLEPTNLIFWYILTLMWLILIAGPCAVQSQTRQVCRVLASLWSLGSRESRGWSGVWSLTVSAVPQLAVSTRLPGWCITASMIYCVNYHWGERHAPISLVASCLLTPKE